MMIKKIPKNRLLLLAGIMAFIIIIGAREIIVFAVDWQFFREIGYEAVFTKTIVAKLLAGLAFGVIAFLTVLISLMIAGRRTFPLSGLNPLWASIPQLQNIDVDRILRGISLLIAVAAFFLAFQVGMRQWEQALLFLNSSPSGLVDPLFGKDISFFLFQYPFIQTVNSLLRSMIMLVTIITAAVYVLRGGVVLMDKFFLLMRT